MRILHVVKSYYPDSEGGIESAIAQLSRATRAHGLRHHVFTVNARGDGRARHASASVAHASPIQARVAGVDFTLTGIPRFGALARRCDVIHYHFPWPCAHLLATAVPSGPPRLATYHADISRNPRLLRLYRPFMQRFLDRLDAVVATSSQYAESSRVLRALDPARLHVIPLGSNPPAADPDPAGGIRRWRAAVGEDFFLFVGVLRYYKGLRVALEALRHGRQRLVIAGEGPEMESLRERARELGVADRVSFHGHVEEADKWALLELCRALVLPSTVRAEAFGMALLEAAAAGRPAITTELGTGTSYVVQHEQTGLVVPPGDDRALAGAMQRLAGDPVLAHNLGQAARRRHEALFTAERYAQAHVRLYRDLLARRSRLSLVQEPPAVVRDRG